jgi:hypothetical protein
MNIIEVGQVYYLFKIHPFRSDLVKPLVAGILVTLLTLLLTRFNLINLSHMNILLIGTCLMLFVGLYFLLIVILKLSDEDKFVIDNILKRFFWQGKQKS